MKQSVSEIVKTPICVEGINALQMAQILAGLDYTRQQTAGALVDVYNDLTASELVLILVNEAVYADTDRPGMIQTLELLGFNTVVILNAINPVYPAIIVTNYISSSGGYSQIRAVPSQTPTDTVLYYINTKGEGWHLGIIQSTVELICRTSDVEVKPQSDSSSSGLFHINKEKHYYHQALFPNHLDLFQQIISLLAYACYLSATFVTIEAGLKWQKTGVLVTPDKLVSISSKSGGWTANPATNNGQFYGPDGNPSRRAVQAGYTLPGANEGGLIGKVADTVFWVGSHVTVPTGLGGELELCINDDLGALYGAGFADNKGSLNVDIVG